MTDISKRFGGLQAVDRVSISLRGGEVLALCGANGAGKSTLVRTLAGVEHADSGRITLDGVPVVIDSLKTAAHHGLSFVHQELNLVPKFTGLQNMAMGADRQSRFGLVATKRLRRLATEVQERLGYRIPLDVPVDSLPVSDRWMVSLGRCLMRSAKFVALDEPTASFTDDEAEKLYEVIKELTASGVGVLYISHRLEEVLEVSDRVTVLRNGVVAGSYESAHPARSQLSGGNQQKVVVGNYLRTQPSVLVLDEPTVGVDVGAREEIYGISNGLAEEGASILVISSDFDELAVCDRVLVMRHGAIVAEVPSHRATKGNLTRLCFEAEEPTAEAV